MPAFATAFGSTILFFADDGVYGRELWASDGTAAGTTSVGNFRTQPYPLASFGEQVVVSASDDTGPPKRWVSGGAGITALPLQGAPLAPQPLTVSTTYLFASAWDRAFGSELWAIRLAADGVLPSR